MNQRRTTPQAVGTALAAYKQKRQLMVIGRYMPVASADAGFVLAAWLGDYGKKQAL